MEDEEKLLKKISASISAYNNGELESSEEETEEQVVLRLVRRAVCEYLGI
ncbi:hypothetical protein KAX02_03515 [candidate division WOR-3 bacterium]|nr:hypothetical protein [candidate division WOR-3 bacterium]